MIIIAGYDVTKNNLVVHKVRYSEFSMPYIHSQEKLQEFRTALVEKHKPEYGENTAVMLAMIQPPENDPKFKALEEFLSGGNDSLMAIAKRNGITPTKFRIMIDEYLSRSKYVKRITDSEQ